MDCKHIDLKRLDDPFALAKGGKTYVCPECRERFHAEMLGNPTVQMGSGKPVGEFPAKA